MPPSLVTGLRELTPTEFEYLIADLWEQMGYQTEVSQQSRDKGIDIRAINQSGEKHLIQAKRHGPNTKLNQQKIQQYGSLYRQEPGVDKVWVVTTNRLTSPAKAIAAEIGIEVVNSEQLIELIDQHDKEKLIEKYLSESKPVNTGTTPVPDSVPEIYRGGRSSTHNPTTAKTDSVPDSVPETYR